MLKTDQIKPCELLPHAGAMCLLRSVIRFDEVSISCDADSHRDENNPLRSHHQLAAINAIEYAAQAMALHAACAYQAGGEQEPLKGYLASVREVNCFEPRLDNLNDDLIVSATRYALLGEGFSYRFSVQAGDKPIINGRLSIRVLRGET